MEKLKCLRCGTEMQFLKQESIQLGQMGILTGAWSNIWAGGVYATIMVCPRCGKLEFFSAECPEDEPGSGIAEIPCPRCGVAYEMDSPKCPCCGEKNPNW